MNLANVENKDSERVGALPRLAAAMLDTLLSAVLAMGMAWKGWGWSNALEVLPQIREMKTLYQPWDEALVQAGLVGGVLGLLSSTALVSLTYPAVEGLTGASPGKWMLGLRVGYEDCRQGDVALYLKRAVVKFIRPVLLVFSVFTGLEVLAWLSGPAGMVISLGSVLLLASHRQALHDKLAATAVYRRRGLEG